MDEDGLLVDDGLVALLRVLASRMEEEAGRNGLCSGETGRQGGSCRIGGLGLECSTSYSACKCCATQYYKLLPAHLTEYRQCTQSMVDCT